MCKPGTKLLEKQINKPTFDTPSEVIKVNLKWSSPNILVKLIPVGASKKADVTETTQQQKIVD